MQTVHIHRVSRLLHLAPSQGHLRRPMEQALEAALETALGRELDSALASRGLAGQEICLRHLHLPLEFDPQRGFGALVSDWSRALASAIAAALDGTVAGEAADGEAQLLRFPSKFHGLLDFARGVARGRLERAWAWHQLGLGALPRAPSRAEARAQLLNALDARRSWLLPLLLQLAAEGELTALLEQLAEPELAWLAAAALAGAGCTPPPQIASLPAAAPLAEERAAGLPPAADTTREPVNLRQLLPQLGHSNIARALERQPALLRRLPAPGHWLLLCLLEREPGLAGGAPALLRARLEVLEAAAGGGTEHSTPAPSRAGAPRGDGAEGQGEGDAPAAQVSGGEPQAAPPAAQLPAPGGRSEEPGVRGETDSREQLREQAARGAEESAQPAAEAELELLHSDWAGLAYLLPLLEAGPLAALQGGDGEPLAARPLGWILWQLLCRLFDRQGAEESQEESQQESPAVAPFPRRDPLLLLLCGLAVDAEADFAEPQAAEAALLECWAGALLADLAARLEDCAERGFALFLWLCRRPGALSLSGPWTEVRLPLDGLDTAVRRAGLDLDPGYVPWLGRVVVLRYE